MLITPAQLIKEPLHLDRALEPGEVDFGSDVLQHGGLRVSGRADLLEEHRGHGETVDDIRLRLHLKGEFALQCARCLEPVPESLDARFDLIYRPAGVDVEPGEHAISEDETEIGYYEKSGLLLEDAVREQVLLTLPGRVLCREDCQGLAAANVTLKAADEATGETGTKSEMPADPRWQALAGLDLKPGPQN